MTLFHCLYFSYFCNSVVAVSAGYFWIKRILYCIVLQDSNKKYSLQRVPSSEMMDYLADK